jgi:septum site-determining protein MinD
LPKIISTHSFRGGTGKSNTTANLAVMVARAGYRVGVIDTDIQSPGIHIPFQVDDASIKHSLNDYLWGRCDIKDAACDVTERCIGAVGENDERPRLFLIPSSLRTGEIARILREGYDVSRLNDGLHDLVRQLRLDYLFIDTHPGVNEETLLSIAISDVLLLIVRPDNQDLQGTAVAVELARKLEVPQMMLIVNKVPPESDAERLKCQIEGLYGAEVVAVLPLNTEIVQLGSSMIFANRYPDHPFTIKLKEVAQRLIR